MGKVLVTENTLSYDYHHKDLALFKLYALMPDGKILSLNLKYRHENLEQSYQLTYRNCINLGQQISHFSISGDEIVVILKESKTVLVLERSSMKTVRKVEMKELIHGY